jgi:hypothetical protein
MRSPTNATPITVNNVATPITMNNAWAMTMLLHQTGRGGRPPYAMHMRGRQTLMPSARRGREAPVAPRIRAPARVGVPSSERGARARRQAPGDAIHQSPGTQGEHRRCHHSSPRTPTHNPNTLTHTAKPTNARGTDPMIPTQTVRETPTWLRRLRGRWRRRCETRGGLHHRQPFLHPAPPTTSSPTVLPCASPR